MQGVLAQGWEQHVHSGAADLRDRYLLGLRQKPLSVDRLFQLFLDHPWYQQQRRLRAIRSLRKRKLSLQRLDEVQQDVSLRLLVKLTRLPHLNVDPAITAWGFAQWLGEIIWNDCQEVTRQLRRIKRREVPLPPLSQLLLLEADSREMQRIDDRLDLKYLLDKLPSRDRRVLQLGLTGTPVRGIAERFDISVRQAYRWRHDALAALRRLLLRAGWEMPSPPRFHHFRRFHVRGKA